MGGLGMGELIVIFMIVMVIFGAKKLPALGDGLGKALKSFKRAVDTTHDEVEEKPKDKPVEGERP